MEGATQRREERDGKVKKLLSGKTKDLFHWSEESLLLRFKDSVTGSGDRLDPGGNEVVGQVAGKGSASLRLSVHFFELLEKAGIATHYLKQGPSKNSMLVKKAHSFGLEVICREKAWGSFLRRYGRHIAAGAPLPALVEFTLKDDERGDPPANEDTLVALGLALPEELSYMKETARRATALLKAYLAQQKLELIDIKYEFGKVGSQILLIDEISGDTMRVRQGNRILLPHEPADIILK